MAGHLPETVNYLCNLLYMSAHICEMLELQRRSIIESVLTLWYMCQHVLVLLLFSVGAFNCFWIINVFAWNVFSLDACDKHSQNIADPLHEINNWSKNRTTHWQICCMLNRMLKEKLNKMRLDLKYIWVYKVLQLQYKNKIQRGRK